MRPDGRGCPLNETDPERSPDGAEQPVAMTKINPNPAKRIMYTLPKGPS